VRRLIFLHAQIIKPLKEPLHLALRLFGEVYTTIRIKFVIYLITDLFNANMLDFLEHHFKKPGVCQKEQTINQII